MDAPFGGGGREDANNDADARRRYNRLMTIVTVVVAIVLVIAIVNIVYLKMRGESPSERSEYYMSAPGDYAVRFLTAEPYRELVVEVDHIAGYPPSENSLALLRQRLETYCEKESIRLIVDDEISAVNAAYSVEDLEKLEREYRDNYFHEETAAVYFLYVNGHFTKNPDTIGVTYHAASVAIFKEQISSIPIPWLLRNRVTHEDFENAVLVHEFGHLIGLVNIGYESDIAHEDPNHENHCIYEECVMYYALETSPADLIDNWFMSDTIKPPTDFCSACQADLAALKEAP